MVQAQKRAKVTDQLAQIRYTLPYVSQSALAAIINWARVHDLPDVCSTREIRKARDDASANISTCYGPLLVEHDFAHADDDLFTKIELLNPFSMLFHMFETSKFFRDCMEHILASHGPCLPTNPLELILYSDEVTPGNQLAHKNKRKVQTIYFSFAEFGELLKYDELWVTCTVVACTEVAKIQGGWSAVVAVVVKQFFSPSDPSQHMTEGGISLRLPDGQRLWLFVSFGWQLSDELAASLQVYCSKGANGLKPCKWCCNVFDHKTVRASVFSDPWAVTHDEPNIRKFVMHTPDTLAKIIADLKHTAETRGGGALSALATAMGYSYEPHGILFDPYLFQLVEPTEHSIPDPMHVLYVNGMVNHHVGRMFYEMRFTTFTYASAYEFCTQWTWPAALGSSVHTGVEALSSSRAAASLAAQNFKASASELRSLVPVLSYFAAETLKRSCTLTDKQKEQLQCFLLLSVVLQEYEAGCRGYCDLDRMESHLQLHMESFVRLLGETGIGCMVGQRGGTGEDAHVHHDFKNDSSMQHAMQHAMQHDE